MFSRERADDIATRPTIPIPNPSGRYRWVRNSTEQETVPPPSSNRRRGIASKFEIAKTLRHPLKMKMR